MDDNRSKEAGLVCLAMLGSAIVGMYTVTCDWSSWEGVEGMKG